LKGQIFHSHAELRSKKITIVMGLSAKGTLLGGCFNGKGRGNGDDVRGEEGQ
jgi:hypothetical protein